MQAQPPQGGCASSRLGDGLKFYEMRAGRASGPLIGEFSDSAGVLLWWYVSTCVTLVDFLEGLEGSLPQVC